jgi:uncharacterized membrane-anchored protein YitT (DUF2179 family)
MEKKSFKLGNINMKFDIVPYLYFLSVISSLIILYTILVSKTNNATVVVIGGLIIGITIYFHRNRCDNCKSIFTIKEDEKKEKIWVLI